MAAKTLDDVFQNTLKDMYDAEKQLTKALPKMAKAASAPKLKAGFEAHLNQTEEQVRRLERVFDELGLPHRGKKCKAMEGLVEEGAEAMEESGSPQMKDALMIAAAQKVEHYEIASYGTLCQLAELLGRAEAKQLLGKSLEEEKSTDEKLTELAQSEVYAAAHSDAEMTR